MSALGFLALIFGTAGVWLTIRKTIWCWPIGLVAVVASLFEFFDQRLYGDMVLQLFYLIAGLYGWYYWNKRSKETFEIARIDPRSTIVLILITAAQTSVYYFLLKQFKGDQPFLDALLTAASLSATYMMTKKWLENWAAWIIIDSAYVFLYVIKNMRLFAVLYLFFALMAYYGWLKWKAELKK